MGSKISITSKKPPTSTQGGGVGALSPPPLEKVVQWLEVTHKTQLEPGSILKRDDSSTRPIYAIVLEDWNGILQCYVANSDRSESLFVEDMLEGPGSWQVFMGDREPTFFGVGEEDLVENAVIVLLQGRGGFLTDEQCALLEYQLGEPELDDKPSEPVWRKIARSIWLPDGESKAVGVLG